MRHSIHSKTPHKIKLTANSTLAGDTFFSSLFCCTHFQSRKFCGTFFFLAIDFCLQDSFQTVIAANVYRCPLQLFVLSFRASDRCHWRGNPFPFSHADRGLFSFSSERKEEKKRRQKLRFWISLRAFACRLSRLSLPRERCAMQISPKCCIVSAPLLAAAFALKCKRTSFYRG